MRALAITILLVLTARPAAAQPWYVPPLPPQLVGSVVTPSDAFDVWWDGGYAYVPDYDAGLHVIDVSNRATPVIVGTWDSPGLAIQVIVDGTRAFVADHKLGGLEIVNVSNPESPGFIGAYISGSTVLSVALMDTLAVAGHLEGHIDIVDVSVPATPIFVGTYATPGAARHIASDGNLLYLADNSFGLLVLDISTPSAPALLGSYATGGRPVGLEVDGNLLYLAGGENGLEVFDISTPSAPLRIGATLLPGPAVKVTRSTSFAFVADHVHGGLQVVELTDPTTPTPAGGYVTGFYGHGVAVVGEYACLADGNGLKVFRVFTDVTAATTPRPRASLTQNHPNPFSGRTRIAWQAPAEGHQQLEVFDAGGRRVRTLLDERHSAGPGEVFWDGHDQNGRRVASGVYFYRLVTDAGSVTRRMVLLR
jgi:hypothetical protein